MLPLINEDWIPKVEECFYASVMDLVHGQPEHFCVIELLLEKFNTNIAAFCIIKNIFVFFKKVIIST